MKITIEGNLGTKRNKLLVQGLEVIVKQLGKKDDISMEVEEE